MYAENPRCQILPSESASTTESAAGPHLTLSMLYADRGFTSSKGGQHEHLLVKSLVVPSYVLQRPLGVRFGAAESAVMTESALRI